MVKRVRRWKGMDGEGCVSDDEQMNGDEGWWGWCK